MPTFLALLLTAIRNRQKTQCYDKLSKAFTERTSQIANWCTFTTWASKQLS
ncbi:hypothetical protein [Spirosoma terrae]|uniref:Uncharacterized protein n=1 Tax=Spirosoma terrae TaxID=1968276 RepID=A0A6L9L8K2_9BACT|nr:hypothetical protein [Spirosoma terrae]NDU94688.1 hypothetical protein [Spirosoma terrae]